MDLVSPRLKLIRTEMDYTQDQMAEIIGISKKTLVQLEKGRQEIGWATAVVVCALFRESALLRSVMGDDPIELAERLYMKKFIQEKQQRVRLLIGGRRSDNGSNINCNSIRRVDIIVL
ncbi:hypothetical protein CSV78_08645 [Sporosarcina sp. P16a]|nr:hypothetical protein CSV78_08645 [Sporosarcina sp. P16a]PIC92675.1 hypothetical protein CSV70_09390 [Sporosarcina sp. P25]